MPPSGEVWEVIGGADKGGIIVREGKDLASPQCQERLSTGARIKELELVDGRLHFERISGTGPKEGWVSVSLKDKILLRRLNDDLDLIVPQAAVRQQAVSSETAKNEWRQAFLRQQAASDQIMPQAFVRQPAVSSEMAKKDWRQNFLRQQAASPEIARPSEFSAFRSRRLLDDKLAAPKASDSRVPHPKASDSRVLTNGNISKHAQAVTIQGSWDQAVIRGDQLIWTESSGFPGDIIRLAEYSNDKLSIHIDGKRLTGEVHPDGKLYWNDGDIWNRVDEATKPVVQIYETAADREAARSLRVAAAEKRLAENKRPTMQEYRREKLDRVRVDKEKEESKQPSAKAEEEMLQEALRLSMEAQGTETGNKQVDAAVAAVLAAVPRMKLGEPLDSASGPAMIQVAQQQEEADFEEAIRLSLADAESKLEVHDVRNESDSDDDDDSDDNVDDMPPLVPLEEEVMEPGFNPNQVLLECAPPPRNDEPLIERSDEPLSHKERPTNRVDPSIGLTPEQVEEVEVLEKMGFEFDVALGAFLAANKDIDSAAEILLQGEEP